MTPAASEPILHRMKILIIDDERMSVTLLEHLLRTNGYSRVEGVSDSREALDVCATFNPDLILLDLIMPNVDGYTLLEKLGAAGDSEAFLPIIVLTADTAEEARERALKAGATDFLVKPVSRTEALLRIRNLLEIRRLHSILENQRAALQEAVREGARQLRRGLAASVSG